MENQATTWETMDVQQKMDVLADGFEALKGNVSSDLTFSGTHDEQILLFAALSKAAGNFEKTVRDSAGQIGNVKFKYANLPQLKAAIMPHLVAEGCNLMQFMTGPDPEGAMQISTVLTGHGGLIHSKIRFSAPVEGENSVKDFGLISTYLRRYSIQSIFILDAEGDLDSKASPTRGQMGPPPNRKPKPESKSEKPKQLGELSEDVQSELFERLKAAGYSKEGFAKLCQDKLGVLPQQLNDARAKLLISRLSDGPAAAEAS
jgi:hypothetical protein